MIKTLADKKCLASVAIFRELYDKGTDIYDVICEFVFDIICNNNKYFFTLTEMTELINTTYSFDLPSSVIKTALRRLQNCIKKEPVNYVVLDKNYINSKNINTLKDEINEGNKRIVDDLLIFAAQFKDNELTCFEKEQMTSAFSAFVLGDFDANGYKDLIGRFLMSNSNNYEFIERLNRIKEGVVLYTGLLYTPNLNEIGRWNAELVIYLDMEIIFHFAGYNGLLFENIFVDFIKLVKEINESSKKKIIRLKYFKETKDEIESFFTKATFIFKGDDYVNPSITAMKSILNGCETMSDILLKKTLLYNLLENNSVNLELYDGFYLEENHKYNILDMKTYNLSKKDNEQLKDYNAFNFINYISILRKEKAANCFKDIGCIFLTGKREILTLDWDVFKIKGTVPHATDIDWITNKFWFCLNKGFGKNMPRSFDVITKAQITLSKMINDSVGSKYDELLGKLNTGKFTREIAQGYIVSLKNEVKKPEEIQNHNIDHIMDALSEDSIERYIEEQEIYKGEIVKREKEFSNLQSELTLKDIAYIELQKQNQELIATNLLKNKAELKKRYENKDKADKMVCGLYNIFKYGPVTFTFLYILFLIIVLPKVTWNIFEPVSYVVGFLPIGGLYLYVAVTEKNWNLLEVLRRVKDKLRVSVYSRRKIDLEGIDQLSATIDQLETNK